MSRWLVLGFILTACSAADAAERPANRVLFIGLDGTRFDAVEVAAAPHLKALFSVGALSKCTNIVGTRQDPADTVSGPGWSNLLTGVWPDKHGVLNNDFKDPQYDRYPHFFARVKEVFPAAKTYAYSTWPEISRRIDRAADESICFHADNGKNAYATNDRDCAAKAIETLKSGDPDVLFVYLGQIDEAGHAHGFHPTVRPYLQAIENVDQHIGDILAALRARPGFDAENWLVLVSTDHGGKGTGHGGGRTTPEINTVFLVVSGAAASVGTIDGPTHQVDVVATALTHLGAPLKPEWQLDGKPVGLK